MPNGVRFNEKLPDISKSLELHARAARLMPAGTQTLAKGATQYVKGVAPLFVDRGKGARIWDVDGNEYLDYNMGIGPLSLGYAYDRVDDAIRRQLEKGITFSLVHPLEVEVAELVSAVVPGAECVRFSKTGCDVTTAAVRLARAYTGRKKVAACGYHGWHDWYIAVTDRNRGIPAETRALTRTFTYNDLASAEAVIDDETACVILEPMLFEAPRGRFLQELKDLCGRRGALLVFDEMWTGFRFALGGAQELFDVKADLATFSKAVANGMPLSVLTGRRDVMELLDKEVFFFTTFGGEALSLAAARETILEMQQKHVPAVLEARGGKLRDGINAVAAELGIEYVRCIGRGARSLLALGAGAGDGLLAKSLLQQELVRRGILWTGMHALSFSHTDADVEYTLEAYRGALTVIRDAVAAGTVRESLKGSPMEPVFRTQTGTPVKR